jgi:hypothetical protein
MANSCQSERWRDRPRWQTAALGRTPFLRLRMRLSVLILYGGTALSEWLWPERNK